MYNISELSEKLANGDFDAKFKTLYHNYNNQKERYLNTLLEFCEVFNTAQTVSIFSAPGRTEIIGNHTDHQHGKAIAASVDLDVIAFTTLNGTDKINIKSKGYPMDSIDINELEPQKSEINKSAGIIRGIISAFKSKGYKVKGFDAYTSSTVLKGSGLSSSAAFEVLIATIINELFCDGNEDAVSIAKIGQYAENVYFGKPCGLLDQTAASYGGFVYMDFKSIEQPAVEKINFNFAKTGYSLCIVDTGGNHSALTDDYSDIFNELKELCRYFGKNYLRQIPEEDFNNRISELMERFSHRAIIRALHIYDENKRVDLLKEALKNSDFRSFTSLITASGNSSFKYIQNAYSLSCVNSQGIPLALNLTEKFLNGEGACRVHGGGFAGTIQAFVPAKRALEYKAYIEKAFGKDKCYILMIRSEGGIRL